MKNRVRLFVNVCALVIFLIHMNVQAVEGFYAGMGYGILEADAEGLYSEDAKNAGFQFGYAISPVFAIELSYSKSVSTSDVDFVRYSGEASRNNFWGLLVSRNPGMTLQEAIDLYPYPYSWTEMVSDVSYETMGIFGVAKTTGDLYVKTRAGFSSVKSTLSYSPIRFEGQIVDINGNVFYGLLDKGSEDFGLYTAAVSGSEEHRETEFSASVGVGYKFTSTWFGELELTRLNKDTEYYALTMNYDF